MAKSDEEWEDLAPADHGREARDSTEARLREFEGSVTAVITEYDVVSVYDVAIEGDIVNHGKPYNAVIEEIIIRLDDFNACYNSEDLSELISIARGKLAEQHSRIGIFGKLKAGKSTLLNALSRSEFFPTDASCPETSIIVSIHHDNTYHQGLCEEGAGCTTKYELKCPLLRVNNGVRAGKSYEIVDILKSINKDCRGQNTSFRECSSHQCDIICNMPVLAENLVLQDTPGFGEARNLTVKHVTTHALYSCSAYIYILDSNKLGDQLDVDTLVMLHRKDPSIFEDGRILVVANQIDCTFEAQAGSRGRKYQVAQQSLDNVKGKIREMVDLSSDFIVPCSARWGWVARTLPYEDAEEDMALWKRKISKVFTLTNSDVADTTKFIEEASQVNQIENWLHTMSLNGEILHKKAVIADIIHCLDTSIELCSQDLHHKQQCAEERISEMEIKRVNWNQLIDLMKDMEEIAELFHSEVEAAYDEDIEPHIQFLRQTVTDHIEQFREKCCIKCRQNQNFQEAEQHQQVIGDNEDSTSSVISGSPPAATGSPFSPPPDSPLSVSVTIASHHTINNDTAPARPYLLNDFKNDLSDFITRLETALKNHINTIKFARITEAIPLQEFGQNEYMLATLSHGLLHYKVEDREPECFVYTQPRHDAILQQTPLALEQLRELTTIDALHLSWWSRVKLWFKTRVHSSNSKENHSMTHNDINSAITYFVDSKCVVDYEDYLKKKVKQSIVDCYHTAYSSLVMDALHHFEGKTFQSLEERVQMLEDETNEIMQQWRKAKTDSEYLVTQKRYLSFEKDRTVLNTSYFTSRKRSMSDVIINSN